MFSLFYFTTLVLTKCHNFENVTAIEFGHGLKAAKAKLNPK